MAQFIKYERSTSHDNNAKAAQLPGGGIAKNKIRQNMDYKINDLLTAV